MNFALPDELVTWQNRVREFVRTELQPHDASIEETGVVPESAMAGLRRMGLFGTNTPREHGGLGLSMLGSCLAIEELAKAHTAFYYLCGVNVHIGSKAIEFYARPEICDRWLPELASGRVIVAFALTEPEAGSDAARITTRVRREGADYILNGKKTYITNAPVAGVFTVFATHDPAAGARGISAFAIDATTPGLHIGRTRNGRRPRQCPRRGDLRGLPRAAELPARRGRRGLRHRDALSGCGKDPLGRLLRRRRLAASKLCDRARFAARGIRPQAARSSGHRMDDRGHDGLASRRAPRRLRGRLAL